MNRTSCSLSMYTLTLLLRLLVSASFVCAENHGNMSDNNSYVLSWKSMESYPAVDAFLRGCMQNYGSKAVDRVKEELSKSGACLERIFFADQQRNDGLLIRILAASSTTTRSLNDAPITILCNNHIPDIEQCIQSFIVALKGCTAVRGDEDLQSLGYAMSSALNYVCQNDGDGIVKFVAEGGSECLKEPYDRSILDCFQLRDSLLNKLQRNVSIFQGENCRIHQRSNECVVRMFQQCTSPSSTVKHIVKGLLDTVMNETKCRSNAVNEGGVRAAALCNHHSFVLLLCITLVLICMRLDYY
uniref:Uncharacterized protein n=1 Tax=Daphnia galeata TaxID=27404 RepID=A0A8J2RP21_9CRUS|nr:unnamed protein product [Daphnia galeata]